MTTMGDFINARLKDADSVANGLTTACRLPGKMPDFFACGGPLAEVFWQTFTPATVGYMLDALKAIVGRHHDDGHGWCHGCQPGAGDDDWGAAYVDFEDCPERRAAAAIWRNHPDYQPEWRPA